MGFLDLQFLHFYLWSLPVRTAVTNLKPLKRQVAHSKNKDICSHIEAKKKKKGKPHIEHTIMASTTPYRHR